MDDEWSLRESVILREFEELERNKRAAAGIDGTETDVGTETGAETEAETDVDTDDDAVSPANEIAARQTNANDTKMVSDDTIEPAVKKWSTMNNSEFISYVNSLHETDLSKGLVGNQYMQSTPQKSTLNRSSVINIESSPFLLAQDNNVFHKTSENEQLINECSITQTVVSPKERDTVINEDDVGADENVQSKDANADENEFSTENNGQIEEYTNYEDYFKEKKSKQDVQSLEYANLLKETNSTQEFPPIFKDCKIHVNGRTDPDILQLRKLIGLYGGKYVHYLSSKSSITHIVAESLPPRKRIQYGNCKVVKPLWIMDSIKNQKLMSWVNYRLDKLNEYGQKEIDFGSRINKVDTKLDEDQNQENLNDLKIDANHPDFLQVFFSKSRLHHLSSWKSDLRSEFLKKAISTLKTRQIPKNSDPKVILHIDFDCFFATVSAKYNTPPVDIQKVACCVTHGKSSADIASCNYIARSFGVTNGMWVSKAKELCPNILCLDYNFDEYERISKKFYETLLEFDINSILPVSIDEALVDISHLCSDGEVSDVARRIKEKVDSVTGCTVSCGVGFNVLLAKLAIKKAKPNGIFVIPQNEETKLNFLNDVPVASLPGFGHKMLEKLSKKYKRKEFTLKDIREIDKSELISLFGVKHGERLHSYSRGLDQTDIDILSDTDKYLRKSISIDVNWGIRFTDDLQVESFLYRLSGELHKRLKDIEMVGSSITLRLSIRHPDAPIEPAKYLGMGLCTFSSKSANLGVATNSIGELSSELKYLWRSLNVNAKDLRGVGVSINKLISSDVTDRQMKLNLKSIPTLLFANSKPIERDVGRGNSSPSPTRPQTDPLNENIDWDVFDQLPVDLQFEIKEELRRRKLQASPKKRKIFKSQNDIGVLVSPKKKTPRGEQTNNDVITPQKIKEYQDEIVLKFQGIPVHNESLLLNKLNAWIDFTINDDEIDVKDMELFYDLMSKLLDDYEILKYTKILNSMSFHLETKKNKCFPGYTNWKATIQNYRFLLEDHSYNDFQFNF